MTEDEDAELTAQIDALNRRIVETQRKIRETGLRIEALADKIVEVETAILVADIEEYLNE